MSNGAITIQQTKRNELRRKGQAALKKVFEELIEGIEGLELYETGDGLVIGCGGINGDPTLTFYWEISSTIKALNYEAALEQEIEKVKREENEFKAQVKAKEEQSIAEKRAKREAKARQKQLAVQGEGGEHDDTINNYDWNAPVIKLKRVN